MDGVVWMVECGRQGARSEGVDIRARGNGEVGRGVLKVAGYG